MNNYLKIALEVAKTSKSRYKIGACIVKGGSVLAVGTNSRKNDAAVVEWTKCSTHAEESVIRQINYTRGGKIYVARILSDGKTAALAMPCPRCMNLINNLGYKAFWTTNDERTGIINGPRPKRHIL